MSAHRILGLKQVPRVGLFAHSAVRELGSERRETVRSLSSAAEGVLRKAVPSTRGPGRTELWCVCCPAKGIAD